MWPASTHVQTCPHSAARTFHCVYTPPVLPCRVSILIRDTLHHPTQDKDVRKYDLFDLARLVKIVNNKSRDDGHTQNTCTCRAQFFMSACDRALVAFARNVSNLPGSLRDSFPLKIGYTEDGKKRIRYADGIWYFEDGKYVRMEYAQVHELHGCIDYFEGADHVRTEYAEGDKKHGHVDFYKDDERVRTEYTVMARALYGCIDYYEGGNWVRTEYTAGDKKHGHIDFYKDDERVRTEYAQGPWYGCIDYIEGGKRVRTEYAKGHTRHGRIDYFEDDKHVRTGYAENDTRHGRIDYLVDGKYEGYIDRHKDSGPDEHMEVDTEREGKSENDSEEDARVELVDTESECELEDDSGEDAISPASPAAVSKVPLIDAGGVQGTLPDAVPTVPLGLDDLDRFVQIYKEQREAAEKRYKAEARVQVQSDVSDYEEKRRATKANNEKKIEDLMSNRSEKEIAHRNMQEEVASCLASIIVATANNKDCLRIHKENYQQDRQAKLQPQLQAAEARRANKPVRTAAPQGSLAEPNLTGLASSRPPSENEALMNEVDAFLHELTTFDTETTFDTDAKKAKKVKEAEEGSDAEKERAANMEAAQKFLDDGTMWARPFAQQYNTLMASTALSGQWKAYIRPLIDTSNHRNDALTAQLRVQWRDTSEETYCLSAYSTAAPNTEYWFVRDPKEVDVMTDENVSADCLYKFRLDIGTKSLLFGDVSIAFDNVRFDDSSLAMQLPGPKPSMMIIHQGRTLTRSDLGKFLFAYQWTRYPLFPQIGYTVKSNTDLVVDMMLSRRQKGTRDDWRAERVDDVFAPVGKKQSDGGELSFDRDLYKFVNAYRSEGMKDDGLYYMANFHPYYFYNGKTTTPFMLNITLSSFDDGTCGVILPFPINMHQSRGGCTNVKPMQRAHDANDLHCNEHVEQQARDKENAATAVLNELDINNCDLDVFPLYPLTPGNKQHEPSCR